MQAWNYLLAGGAVAWGAWSWRRYRRAEAGEAYLNLTAAAAGGLKLWLARGQPLCAVPAAPWDDRLFLQLTGYLLGGQWLGPYTRLTLAKGPFYPIFMAGAGVLKLPLITAHNLVYIAASWLFVRALRPLKLPIWVRAVFLVVLLLCPILADSGSFVRAWRQSLWPGLVLLSLAGAVGLSLREQAGLRWQAIWALVAGAAAGAMWLTREEAIWTLPMLLGPVAIAGWRGWHSQRRGIRLICLAMPLVIAGAAVSLVSWKNLRTYGFWGIVEFRDDAFVSAYSALCRVKPLDPQRRVPVTRAAREKIYAVSPAFASLRHEIEEGIGAAFMQVTEDNTGIPTAEHQIGGGWMMWTLREAVANTGQANSALAARAFYRRLALEVDTACDDGRLDALPRRHSMMPPWDRSYLPKFWAGAWLSLKQIVDYPLTVDPVPSAGSPEDLAWAEAVVHERASPADAAGTAALGKPRRLAFLRGSVTVYGEVIPGLFAVALGAWIFFLIRAAYSRELPWLIAVGSGIAVAIAGNIAVVALINATSWPSISLGYLGASVPLALCFIGVILAQITMAVEARRSRPPT
jgi:hypothetical protein